MLIPVQLLCDGFYNTLITRNATYIRCDFCVTQFSTPPLGFAREGARACNCRVAYVREKTPGFQGSRSE